MTKWTESGHKSATPDPLAELASFLDSVSSGDAKTASHLHDRHADAPRPSPNAPQHEKDQGLKPSSWQRAAQDDGHDRHHVKDRPDRTPNPLPESGFGYHPVVHARPFIADNYTQDTREWPDPTEPRAAKPPVDRGCTCIHGQKLDCPIHGLHGDDSNDVGWSLPEGSPVGYPQDEPRSYQMAMGSFAFAFKDQQDEQGNDHPSQDLDQGKQEHGPADAYEDEDREFGIAAHAQNPTPYRFADALNHPPIIAQKEPELADYETEEIELPGGGKATIVGDLKSAVSKDVDAHPSKHGHYDDQLPVLVPMHNAPHLKGDQAHKDDEQRQAHRPIIAVLPSHQLSWNPGQPGKGFVLENGSVWTWPTQDMRPMHWQMDGRVKAQGQRQIPGSSFHITPEGVLWQHGEGRNLDSNARAMIQSADPSLMIDTLAPPAPVIQDQFGHAQALMENIPDRFGPGWKMALRSGASPQDRTQSFGPQTPLDSPLQGRRLSSPSPFEARLPSHSRPSSPPLFDGTQEDASHMLAKSLPPSSLSRSGRDGDRLSLSRSANTSYSPNSPRSSTAAQASSSALGLGGFGPLIETAAYGARNQHDEIGKHLGSFAFAFDLPEVQRPEAYQAAEFGPSCPARASGKEVLGGQIGGQQASHKRPAKLIKEAGKHRPILAKGQPDFNCYAYRDKAKEMAKDGYSEREVAQFGDFLAHHNEADRDSGELNDIPKEQVEKAFREWQKLPANHSSSGYPGRRDGQSKAKPASPEGGQPNGAYDQARPAIAAEFSAHPPIIAKAAQLRIRPFAYSSREAAQTRTQLLDQAAQLPEDRSQIIHQFLNGWTMRQLNTYGDMEREGQLMGNCFRAPRTPDAPSHYLWQSHPEIERSNEWGYGDYRPAPERLEHVHTYQPREQALTPQFQAKTLDYPFDYPSQNPLFPPPTAFPSGGALTVTTHELHKTPANIERSSPTNSASNSSYKRSESVAKAIMSVRRPSFTPSYSSSHEHDTVLVTDGRPSTALTVRASGSGMRAPLCKRNRVHPRSGQSFSGKSIRTGGLIGSPYALHSLRQMEAGGSVQAVPEMPREDAWAVLQVPPRQGDGSSQLDGRNQGRSSLRGLPEVLPGRSFSARVGPSTGNGEAGQCFGYGGGRAREGGSGRDQEVRAGMQSLPWVTRSGTRADQEEPTQGKADLAGSPFGSHLASDSSGSHFGVGVPEDSPYEAYDPQVAPDEFSANRGVADYKELQNNRLLGVTLGREKLTEVELTLTPRAVVSASLDDARKV